MIRAGCCCRTSTSRGRPRRRFRCGRSSSRCCRKRTSCCTAALLGKRESIIAIDIRIVRVDVVGIALLGGWHDDAESTPLLSILELDFDFDFDLDWMELMLEGGGPPMQMPDYRLGWGDTSVPQKHKKWDDFSTDSYCEIREL